MGVGKRSKQLVKQGTRKLKIVEGAVSGLISPEIDETNRCGPPLLRHLTNGWLAIAAATVKHQCNPH